MNANLGRQIRLEKIYSRARDRTDLLRTVDDEIEDDFEFPLQSEPLDEEQQQTLANLMSVEDTPMTLEPAVQEALMERSGGD